MPTAPLIEGRGNEWRQLLDINVMGVLNGISAGEMEDSVGKSGLALTGWILAMWI